MSSEALAAAHLQKYWQGRYILETLTNETKIDAFFPRDVITVLATPGLVRRTIADDDMDFA